MIIRKEKNTDFESITNVTIEAFKNHPISRQTEHFIINALRSADALRRFLSKNIPSSGSFCPSSLLRKCLHSGAMLPFPRREDAQKSSIIWDILFRQSPNYLFSC